MSDQTPTLDDDFLDGCAIDFNEYADDEATQAMRPLFPDAEVDREIEWRALFREEDLDDIEGRLLKVMAEEAVRGAGNYSGSGRDTGIAARLRAMGLKVIEVAGWQTRGLSTFNPKGSVDHHTASAKGSNAPALGICTNGRSDLPGPLCHVLIARDNTCYVIASGKANHAGSGSQWGISGNSNVYGVERENTGTGTEPWREDQRVTAAKVHAALLQGIAPGYRRVCEHRDWAPTRKIDAWNQSKEDLQARVNKALSPTPAPEPEPEPKKEEPDMSKPMLARFGPKGAHVIYVSAAKRVTLAPKNQLAGYKHMQNLDGASPDVCALAGRNADGTFTNKDAGLQQITEAIVTLPFDGPMPSGWSAWWQGPQYPATTVELKELMDGLPAKIIAALPPAAVGGFSLEDIKGQCVVAIKETLGPVFDQIQ